MAVCLLQKMFQTRPILGPPLLKPGQLARWHWSSKGMIMLYYSILKAFVCSHWQAGKSCYTGWL